MHDSDRQEKNRYTIMDSAKKKNNNNKNSLYHKLNSLARLFHSLSQLKPLLVAVAAALEPHLLKAAMFESEPQRMCGRRTKSPSGVQTWCYFEYKRHLHHSIYSAHIKGVQKRLRLNHPSGHELH